jgi:hypothetical protein
MLTTIRSGAFEFGACLFFFALLNCVDNLASAGRS